MRKRTPRAWTVKIILIAHVLRKNMMSIKFSSIRLALRLAIALLYFIAGFFHITSPAAFELIMPGWAPYPHAVIILTGYCELVGALGLLLPPLRTMAAKALALYAICVFPANIVHAFGHVIVPGIPDSWWYHAPRLLAQPVLIWVTLFSARLLTWPFRTNAQD